MSRLSHRHLDRHLTEQDEEIQYQREQDELNARNDEINQERLHEEALKEHERIIRQEEIDDYLDELHLSALRRELGYDPYEDYHGHGE